MTSPTPRTDLVTVAALVAENAALRADLEQRHTLLLYLLAAMRDLPERPDDPPFVRCVRVMAHASPDQLQAFADEFSPRD